MWPFRRRKKVDGSVAARRAGEPVPVVDTVNWDWEPVYYDGPAIFQVPRMMSSKHHHFMVMIDPDQVISWGDLPDPEVGRMAMEALMGLFMVRSSECPKHFWCGEFQDLSMIVEAYLGAAPDGSVGPYIGVFLWQVSSFEETETTGLVREDGMRISGFDVVTPGKPWMKALLQPLAGGYVGVRYGFLEQVEPGLSWNDQGLLIPETVEVLQCGFRSFPRMVSLPSGLSASTFMLVRHGGRAWTFGRCFKKVDPGRWVALEPEVELPVGTVSGHW